MKNTNKNSLSISGLCLILLTVLFSVNQAHAQGGTLIVNTLTDGDDTACNAANCTLREAVKYAPAGSTISFSVTGIIQLVGAGVSRDLVINKNLTIAGPGADSLTVKAADGYAVEIFDIRGGIVTISGLKLSDGNGNAITTLDPNTGLNSTLYYGGAVYIAGGTVTLTNCILSNNTAQYGGAIYLGGGSLAVTSSTISGNNIGSRGYGGGIRVRNGSLAVASSTISGNIAGFGGGLDISGGGTATIDSSTISGNTARAYESTIYTYNGNGGGIYIGAGGTATVTNSTISGNIAEGTNVIFGSTATQPDDVGGGGICNSGVLTVANSTVTANYAKSDGGGGIDTSLGTSLQLSNSILANNFLFTLENNTPGTDLQGSASGNYNLVQNLHNSTRTMLSGTNNITGQPALLGPLANNGGPTQTHALLAGSPAANAGDPAFDTTNTSFDQRGSGNARKSGSTIDIGAFEVQLAPTAATVSVSGRVITQSGRGIRNVVVTMTDMQGNGRTATSTSFGYYRFENVAAGETYIFAARGKRFFFGQSAQVHSIMEDTNDINFVANQELKLQQISY
jgi:CSLREA domain-containing protein